jgi:hypothetical protein
MVGVSRRRSLGGELQMPMNVAVSPLGGEIPVMRTGRHARK